MATQARKNRLAREFDMLTRDPPPGIAARAVSAEEAALDENVAGEAGNKDDVRLSVRCVLQRSTWDSTRSRD